MTDNFTGEPAREPTNGNSLHIAETAEKVFARAQETYEDVRAKAKVRFSEADTMMRERPYAALGLAAFAGFLLGHIIASGRSNVVYLKDVR